MKNFQSSSTIVIFLINLISSSLGIIILDRGDPTRVIRDSQVQHFIQQPSISSFSSQSQQEVSQEPQQILSSSEIRMETVMKDLNEFNEAMTSAMISLAKELTPQAAVNMCRFSRTRMTALKITQTFQALSVQTADVRMNTNNEDDAVTSGDDVLEQIKSEMIGVTSAFIVMEDDLRHYDETKLGTSPILKFAKAIKTFSLLHADLFPSVAEKEEVEIQQSMPF